MTNTHEILLLMAECKEWKDKLEWMENNNWTFKICTAKKNPFNERLDYFNIAHHVLELEHMIAERKLRLKNYYSNNFRPWYNYIFE